MAAVATTAILGTAAQAGAQAPRAMPADYAARDAASIEPGDYGMPRAMPADYAVYFAGEVGNGSCRLPHGPTRRAGSSASSVVLAT